MVRPALVTVPSRHSAAETLARLEAALQAKGITVFARIDHAAGAAQAGMSLRPTVLVVFGNPAAGTPLMQADQRVGLDLPLKVLIWEDEAHKAWLSYRDPTWLETEYGLGGTRSSAVRGLSTALAALARAATG